MFFCFNIKHFQLTCDYGSRSVQFISLQLFKSVFKAFYSFFLKAVAYKEYVWKFVNLLVLAFLIHVFLLILDPSLPRIW